MMPAVFLDRDGVLNRNVYYSDTHAYESPRTADDLALHNQVHEGLGALVNAGFRLFLISNQPNAAKGKSTLEQLLKIHDKLGSLLSASSIEFEECYYCFHHPQSKDTPLGGPCACRKPSTYFLYKAVRDHQVKLTDSWLVGDRASDIACGAAAGMHTVRIQPDHPHGNIYEDKPEPNFMASNLWDAVQVILQA